MCEVVWHQEIMHLRCKQVKARIAEGDLVAPLHLLCDIVLDNEKAIAEHWF